MARFRWIHWTLAEVAAAVGKSVHTVSSDATKGLLDRKDITSVARYIVGKPTDLTEARRLALALAVALDVDKQAPAWKPGDSWQTFGGKLPTSKGIH